MIFMAQEYLAVIGVLGTLFGTILGFFLNRYTAQKDRKKST